MPSEFRMIWPAVIGQHRVKNQLRALLSAGRLAHAYLFHGEEGVGKDAMALQLAAVLHCEREGIEPCGSCKSCRMLARLQHPDVHLVFSLPTGQNESKGDAPFEKLTGPDLEAAREQIRLKAGDPYHRITIPRASLIRVNSIREIRREAMLSTSGSRRRVVIISRADEMNEEASNALLKILEEPTGNTLFLLTSAYPDRLLPTIRSRCHLVRFDVLSASEISERLIYDGVATEEAHLVAHLSMGSYLRSRELLSEDVESERSLALEFIRLALGSSFTNLMARIDVLAAEKDRDRVIRFLNLVGLWFRDALVLREGRAILNADQRESLERFLARFPAADFPAIIDETDQAVSLVRRNGYIPLVLIRLSIRLKRIILPARS